MSSNAHVMKFIALVDAHFPRPRFKDDEPREAIWLRSLSEVLGEFDVATLKEAAAEILRTRDPDKHGTMFPKPAECLKACEKARERLQLRATPLLESQERLQQRIAQADAWSADRVKLARELMAASSCFEQAKRDGWADALFHFCRENRRTPSHSETSGLIEAQAAHSALMTKLGLATDTLSRELFALGKNVGGKTKALMTGKE